MAGAQEKYWSAHPFTDAYGVLPLGYQQGDNIPYICAA